VSVYETTQLHIPEDTSFHTNGSRNFRPFINPDQGVLLTCPALLCYCTPTLCVRLGHKHLLAFVSFILYQFQYRRGSFAFRCCLLIRSSLVLRLKSKSRVSATNLCSNFQPATQTSVAVIALATLNYTFEPCCSISTSRFVMWSRMGHCNQSNCICFVFF
jgi:hypothetical protein